MYSKSSYVSPAVTVIRMESAAPLAASLDSHDKTDETIKGEESLSRENGGVWEDDED